MSTESVDVCIPGAPRAGRHALPDAVPLSDGTAGDAAYTRPRALRSSPYAVAMGGGLLGKAVLTAARLHVRAWDRALSHVEEVQRRTLRTILGHSRGTEFGVAHAFQETRTYEAFCRRVPIGDYDSFSPFIDRMRKGETNLLVPEFVRHFGNSSGSSTHGKSKFLPITSTQIAHQRRAGSEMVLRYLAQSGDADFFRGFSIGLFPPTTMKAEGPVLITSNPALMVTELPFFTAPVYLPQEPIRSIANYDAKLAAIAERYLDWDVRAVSGTTCWFSLLFDKVLEVARRRGRRASVVADIWPNLRVLFGGGVSADPYLPILRRLAGRDDLVLVDSYNASEGGIYATSDETRARGMLMIPHRGTFFEFVPLEEHEKLSPTRVPLWAVERDRSYAIVVTTTSGLYAYKLGDIVRFPSLNPLRIEFVGRLSGCLSVTQELTTHVEIERAVAHAVAKVPCQMKDFGAAADVGVNGTAKSRYVLFVEFAEGAEPNDPSAFAEAFDEGLCQENRVYREHRGGEVALLAPKVMPLVHDGAKKFLNEVTRGNVQGKFPRILDDARKAQLLPYVRVSE